MRILCPAGGGAEVAGMRRETNADDLSSPSAFTLPDRCSE
jgi:hypothetical protein